MTHALNRCGTYVRLITQNSSLVCGLLIGSRPNNAYIMAHLKSDVQFYTPLGSSSPPNEEEPIFFIKGSFLDNLKLALAPRFSLTDSFCKRSIYGTVRIDGMTSSNIAASPMQGILLRYIMYVVHWNSNSNLRGNDHLLCLFR